MRPLHLHNDVARTYVIAMVVSGIILWLRMEPPIQYFITNSLAFEDGSIFLGSALKFGLHSIWEPYAGYLHIYPRLISLVAVALPLEIAPNVFFLGWASAFSFMLYVIVTCSLAIKSSMASSILIVLLVCLLPNSGEVFFCLTNSQWFLAVALILYFCIPVPSLHPRLEGLLVALLALTGPFSVLLLPVVFFRVMVRRDFQQYRWPYIAILVGATVQTNYMLSSHITSLPVINGGVMSTVAASSARVMDWVAVAGRFVFFGGFGLLVIILSTVFWALFCFFVASSVSKKSSNNNEVAAIDSVSVYSLLMAALIMLVAGLVKNSAILPLIGPLTGGARYFIIPYALIAFLAVTISAGRGVLRYILLSVLIIICALLFVKIDRENLYFRAYLHLAQRGHFVSIPFYPAGFAQPLEIKAGFLKRNTRSKDTIQILSTGDLSIATALAGKGKNMGIADKVCDGCTYITDVGNKCKESPVTSLEFHGVLGEPGMVKVWWGDKDWQSYERYYPAGENAMQFAFAANKRPIQYKVSANGGKNLLKLSQVRLLCYMKTTTMEKP